MWELEQERNNSDCNSDKWQYVCFECVGAKFNLDKASGGGQ